MSHQSGQSIIVPEPDLLVGHGIVLVDHGDHPEVEQSPEGLSSVEVLAAMYEVERCHQHLAGHEAALFQRVRPHLHQPVLPHRGHGLQRGQVGRARLVGSQRGPSGGDRPGGDHHHPDAGGPGLTHLAGQLVDGCRVHPPRAGGDRGGPDLDHHCPLGGVGARPFHGHDRRRRVPALPVNSGWSRVQTKASSPMWTTSPSRAPARARARSTPIRRSLPCT